MLRVTFPVGPWGGGLATSLLTMLVVLPLGLAPLYADQQQAAEEKDPRPPNVLFISIDDLNNSLGTYGHPQVKSPHIDRLAAQGVRFDRAYSQYPLCAPSRASVLSGVRPEELRIYDLTTHFRDRLPEVITLPQLFRNHGYVTARVGKIYHYNVPSALGTDGLDDPASWDITRNPSGRDREDEETIINVMPDRHIGHALSWREDPGTDEEQTDGLVAGEAVRLLEEMQGRPFFLAVGFFRPHTPYVAPKRYFDLYPLETIAAPLDPRRDLADVPAPALYTDPPNWDLSEEDMRRSIRAYYAAVSFVDAQVGRVLDALRRLGLADRTIVVLWSDHGHHLGEHGQWLKNTLFEEAARAPLIISSPGHVKGRSSGRTVELLDLYPTLADLAGLSIPEHVRGRSLQPLLQDPGAAWPHPATTVVRRTSESGPFFGRSIRTERWRYTEWDAGRLGAELYDHEVDPGEQINLATVDAYGAMRDSLRALLPAYREP